VHTTAMPDIFKSLRKHRLSLHSAVIATSASSLGARRCGGRPASAAATSEIRSHGNCLPACAAATGRAEQLDWLLLNQRACGHERRRGQRRNRLRMRRGVHSKRRRRPGQPRAARARGGGGGREPNAGHRRARNPFWPRHRRRGAHGRGRRRGQQKAWRRQPFCGAAATARSSAAAQRERAQACRRCRGAARGSAALWRERAEACKCCRGCSTRTHRCRLCKALRSPSAIRRAGSNSERSVARRCCSGCRTRTRSHRFRLCRAGRSPSAIGRAGSISERSVAPETRTRRNRPPSVVRAAGRAASMARSHRRNPGAACAGAPPTVIRPAGRSGARRGAAAVTRRLRGRGPWADNSARRAAEAHASARANGGPPSVVQRPAGGRGVPPTTRRRLCPWAARSARRTIELHASIGASAARTTAWSARSTRRIDGLQLPLSLAEPRERADELGRGLLQARKQGVILVHLPPQIRLQLLLLRPQRREALLLRAQVVGQCRQPCLPDLVGFLGGGRRRGLCRRGRGPRGRGRGGAAGLPRKSLQPQVQRGLELVHPRPALLERGLQLLAPAPHRSPVARRGALMHGLRRLSNRLPPCRACRVHCRAPGAGTERKRRCAM